MAEFIQCAAIQIDDGRVFSKPRPDRHHHVIWAIRDAGYQGDVGGDRQGFLTNAGRFVGREEGLSIATAAEQIIHKAPPGDKLFTDDMW